MNKEVTWTTILHWDTLYSTGCTWYTTELSCCVSEHLKCELQQRTHQHVSLSLSLSERVCVCVCVCVLCYIHRTSAMALNTKSFKCKISLKAAISRKSAAHFISVIMAEAGVYVCLLPWRCITTELSVCSSDCLYVSLTEVSEYIRTCLKHVNSQEIANIIIVILVKKRTCWHFSRTRLVVVGSSDSGGVPSVDNDMSVIEDVMMTQEYDVGRGNWKRKRLFVSCMYFCKYDYNTYRKTCSRCT